MDFGFEERWDIISATNWRKKMLEILIDQMSGYIYAGEASREKPGRGGSRSGFYDAGSPTEERTEIRRPSDWWVAWNQDQPTK